MKREQKKAPTMNWIIDKDHIKFKTESNREKYKPTQNRGNTEDWSQKIWFLVLIPPGISNCDFGQVIQPLWALLSSSVKWREYQHHRIVVESNHNVKIHSEWKYYVNSKAAYKHSLLMLWRWRESVETVGKKAYQCQVGFKNNQTVVLKERMETLVDQFKRRI